MTEAAFLSTIARQPSFRCIYDIMNTDQYCVIMAGGGGNRLWPLSRESRPKQFLMASGFRTSLIRLAFNRCRGLVPDSNIFIVTPSRFKSLVEEQIPELPAENLMPEPYGRGTAPCTAYITYRLLKRNPNAVVAMLPADLIIHDVPKFQDSVKASLDYASANQVLITLGVVPRHPDTEFGYIQVRGGRKALDGGKPAKVKTFTEKPDKELAKVFCQSGEFFWNSGVFVWQAEVIRREMEKFIPATTAMFKGWENKLDTPEEAKFVEHAYAGCENQSIDFGVMEKTDKAWLFPAAFDWNDIETWDSVASTLKDRDELGNATNVRRKLFADNRDSLIISKNENKVIAVKGLHNFIVVDTPDVLLICPKDDSDYRDFVADTALPEFDDVR